MERGPRSPAGPPRRFEVPLTRAAIAATLVAMVLLIIDMARPLARSFRHGPAWTAAQSALFALVVAFLVYGNLIYQYARLGHLKRLLAHRPASVDELEAFAYGGRVPPLAILVPSYREELHTIEQTLLSAALQDYPDRRVVLLIDDPPDSGDPAACRHLDATRALVGALQRRFAMPATALAAYRDAYLARQTAGTAAGAAETARLAKGYAFAARCLAAFRDARAPVDHTDRFFVEQVLEAPHRAHQVRADALRALLAAGDTLDERAIEREYRRLASLFAVAITCFERKQYANLSHAPNKAMNLNSYIDLLGKRLHERRERGRTILAPAGNGPYTLAVPPADYIITLDADSLLMPGYASRLVHFMEQPGRERIGVVQTPYSAIPHTPRVLERIAGATTDIQYIVHQGFTHFNATFWVGANALLRTSALDAIRVVEREGNKEIAKYIQDRTVIEDTESTIDLVSNGWQLHNYPERLAYSATPADFGALLIQRRRWANGGLIILPKLLRHLLLAPNRRERLGEAAMRLHYLTSIAGVSVGLLALLALPLGRGLPSIWLPFTALPYYALYWRDLLQLGYRRGDILRVYALNLMLVPINIGGVLMSLYQGVTGKKIPFGRTPKVANRTAAPVAYLVAEYALLGYLLYATAVEALAGRWGNAAFALANALLFGYIIARYIGVRASMEDIALRLGRR